MNFFSHSVICLFIPLMVSFTEQLYIIFMKLDSSILSFFMNHTSFGVMSKHSLALGLKDFLFSFFSQNLFYFKFYFMVHVGLFLYKMSFFFFAYECPVALSLCVEKAICPPLNYFHTCFENQVDIFASISRFFILFH